MCMYRLDLASELNTLRNTFQVFYDWIRQGHKFADETHNQTILPKSIIRAFLHDPIIS